MVGLRRHLGGLLIGVVAALAWASPASAVTFDVNTTKDGVDANIGDDACANPKGKCSLRAAIDEANDTPGGDEIKLPKGTFELKRAASGAVSNAEGDLDITERVQIDGRSPRKTVIEQTVKDRVLRNVAPASIITPVELSDLTLTGGRVGGIGENGGAGFQNDDGFAILTDVVIRGNVARSDTSDNVPAGGIWSRGLLGLSDTTVRDNVARGRGATFAEAGGVMVADGGAGFQDGTRIVGNRAELLDRDGNYQPEAGGLMVRNPGAGPDDSVTVTDSTIARNSSLGGPGARAGGIEAAPGANLSITASTISGNRSKQGGGVWAVGSSVDVTNSTFSGNSDTGGGGAAIYAQVDTGDFDSTHVTFARNQPSAGHSSIDVTDPAQPSSVTFSSSIVANPGPECGGDFDAFATSGYNVWGNQCGPFNDLVASPKLKALADYGGPTLTHALKSSSPAIDLVPSCSLGVDQRYAPRAIGMPCASGSFERGVAP